MSSNKTPGNGNEMTKKPRMMRKKKMYTASVDSSYKWPYYDSYVPGLNMNEADRKIVRLGIKRQYYPNE